MKPTDLRAWQAAMSYTYDSAAVALGVNRSTYASWLRKTDPVEIDLRTALACSALDAGLKPWTSCADTTADCFNKVLLHIK